MSCAFASCLQMEIYCIWLNGLFIFLSTLRGDVFSPVFIYKVCVENKTKPKKKKIYHWSMGVICQKKLLYKMFIIYAILPQRGFYWCSYALVCSDLLMLYVLFVPRTITVHNIIIEHWLQVSWENYFSRDRVSWIDSVCTAAVALILFR